MTPEELRKRREENRPAPEDVQFGPNGELEDHPLNMIKELENKGISTENGNLMNLLTSEEKEKLLKMIKHGEFNQKEAAFLKYLIKTSGRNLYASLDDCAAMYGAVSPKTQGQPVATQFMYGKLQDILANVFRVHGPKFGVRLKSGKTGKDIIKFMELNAKQQKVIKKIEKESTKNAEKARRQAMKEFWEEWRALNKARKEIGLPYKGAKELAADIDNFPNKDGTRGLKSRGQKVELPLRSINYHGGSDAIDRKEGRYEDK